MTNSMQHLTEKHGEAGELDLSAMRSDLVSSAATMFASGWSDALELLTLTSRGLGSGVDETARDFMAAEDAHIDSLTASIDALEE